MVGIQCAIQGCSDEKTPSLVVTGMQNEEVVIRSQDLGQILMSSTSHQEFVMSCVNHGMRF